MFVVKYAQVLDFVLKTIYDVNLQAPNRYLSLPSVVHSIGYASSFSGIGDMADYLETRGFIRRSNVLGDILVQITTQGILHIEALDENFDEIYHAYLKKRNSKNGNTQYALATDKLTPEENPKAKVILLVDNIKSEISEKEGGATDFVKDLEIVKTELSKANPDFRIIQIKLNDTVQPAHSLEKMTELRNYIAHAE